MFRPASPKLAGQKNFRPARARLANRSVVSAWRLRGRPGRESGGARRIDICRRLEAVRKSKWIRSREVVQQLLKGVPKDC